MSFTTRDWLKEQIDKMSDDEIKLLSYRLEKEVDEYNRKREEKQDDQEQRQAD